MGTALFSTQDSMSTTSFERTSGSRDPEEGNHPTVVAGASDGYGASWLMQYTVLFRRALKVRRFEALSLQDLAQCICVSVLSGTPFPAKFPIYILTEFCSLISLYLCSFQVTYYQYLNRTRNKANSWLLPDLLAQFIANCQSHN